MAHGILFLSAPPIVTKPLRFVLSPDYWLAWIALMNEKREEPKLLPLICCQVRSSGLGLRPNRCPDGRGLLLGERHWSG